MGFNGALFLTFNLRFNRDKIAKNNPYLVLILKAKFNTKPIFKNINDSTIICGLLKFGQKKQANLLSKKQLKLA
ncbi:hypothetical protein DB891_10195 [Flavobacterium laiguense]|uniref:Uncharacterized protein n=1 Tax=Flavobacterium laiguense TaxID=2169409 RepID=A0A2U1JUG5_9FLAO|nr:hypothetical protein DB891_10195 [Flavobacterium laiguense]